MDSFRSLVTRDADSAPALSPAMVDGIIALLVLIFVGLLAVGGLYMIRKVRRSRAIARQSLPTYESSTRSNRLTITTTPYGVRTSNIYVYDEKSSLSGSSSPPLTPESVPEIRITFPDELDESGRSRSGRVVVVRVGENAVGLEPLDEQLPAYEKESQTRFQSLDMDRMGGLKEKSSWS